MLASDRMELLVHRKRMKKNAKWQPSGYVVRHKLITAGRGPHNYLKAKAEARGVNIVDEDGVSPERLDEFLVLGEEGLQLIRDGGLGGEEAEEKRTSS